jgi:hypothetical protein
LAVSSAYKQRVAKLAKKTVWPYLLLFAFFVYLYVQIFSFRVNGPHNFVVDILYFIEFGMHEASHIIVAFLPPVFVALAGSVGEIGFTVLLAAVALKSKAYYISSFALLWMMLACTSVGNYISDARTQAIPLVGVGENIQHDWHYILGQWGMLSSDTAIGGAVLWTGRGIGIIALLLTLYQIFNRIYYNWSLAK